MTTLREAAQQEPVGEIDWAGGVENSILEISLYRTGRNLPPGTKLYAAPQAREPLTDEQIDAMWREATIKPALTSEFVRTFARAIEAAHGIKEKA